MPSTQLFSFVASMKHGSEIVFSFVVPDAHLDGDDLDAAIGSATRTAALGEPWKARLQPHVLLGRLSDLGFAEIFHLTPELAQQRYFAGRQGCASRAPMGATHCCGRMSNAPRPMAHTSIL